MTSNHPFCKPSLVTALLCGALIPSLGFASTTDLDVRRGAQILRSTLPPGTTLEHADCSMLSLTLHQAILKHRKAATPIFVAALTGGQEPTREAVLLPCVCVTNLFRAAASAAPEKAVAMLEQAIVLYPDCGSELTAVVERLEGKNVVIPDGKDGLASRPSGYTSSIGGRASGTDSFGNPVMLNEAVPAGIDAGAPSAIPGVAGNGSVPAADGFGAGFGPGFPGSPGFSGSTPGGGSAFQPGPTVPIVTPDANE